MSGPKAKPTVIRSGMAFYESAKTKHPSKRAAGNFAARENVSATAATVTFLQQTSNFHNAAPNKRKFTTELA
jgi:hypothetical protein